MANKWYNRGLYLNLSSSLDLAADTLKVLLLKGSGYSFDPDHNFVADLTPASNEVSGGSYARQTLAGKSVTEDDANDRAAFDCSDLTFSAVPAQGGGAQVTALVLFKEVTNDADSPLLAFFDTVTGLPFTPSGSDVVFQVAAAGLLLASSA